MDVLGEVKNVQVLQNTGHMTGLFPDTEISKLTRWNYFSALEFTLKNTKGFTGYTSAVKNF